MKNDNDTKTVANNKSQQELINSRIHTLLRWFHGTTTRFIAEAKSICGSEDGDNYTEMRELFTRFMGNELERLQDVINLHVDIHTTEVPVNDTPDDIPSIEETPDDDDPLALSKEEIDNIAASEELFIYQDLLEDRIIEESKLKAEIASLNHRIAVLELSNQKLRNNGNQESGE